MSDEATVGAFSWDGYIDLLEHSAKKFDHERLFITGTLSAQRDWDEMREEAEHTGEAPWAVLEEPTVHADEHKQYADYGFPSHGFEDAVTTDDLEAADTTLMGTVAFPHDVVKAHHPRVLTHNQLLNRVRELRDALGEDYAVLTGMFNPEGGFNVSEAGGFMRIGQTWFPADAFTTSGIGGVQKGYTSIAGTLLVRRNDLSEETLAVVDGEEAAAGPEEGEVEA